MPIWIYNKLKLSDANNKSNVKIEMQYDFDMT